MTVLAALGKSKTRERALPKYVDAGTMTFVRMIHKIVDGRGTGVSVVSLCTVAKLIE